MSRVRSGETRATMQETYPNGEIDVEFSQQCADTLGGSVEYDPLAESDEETAVYYDY